MAARPERAARAGHRNGRRRSAPRPAPLRRRSRLATGCARLHGSRPIGFDGASTRSRKLPPSVPLSSVTAVAGAERGPGAEAGRPVVRPDGPGRAVARARDSPPLARRRDRHPRSPSAAPRPPPSRANSASVLPLAKMVSGAAPSGSRTTPPPNERRHQQLAAGRGAQAPGTDADADEPARPHRRAARRERRRDSSPRVPANPRSASAPTRPRRTAPAPGTGPPRRSRRRRATAIASPSPAGPADRLRPEQPPADVPARDERAPDRRIDRHRRAAHVVSERGHAIDVAGDRDGAGAVVSDAVPLPRHAAAREPRPRERPVAVQPRREDRPAPTGARVSAASPGPNTAPSTIAPVIAIDVAPPASALAATPRTMSSPGPPARFDPAHAAVARQSHRRTRPARPRSATASASRRCC